MTREDFLLNWNNIDIIKDVNGVEFVINKKEAYRNKEEFINHCIDNDLVGNEAKVDDVKVGGISCYVSMGKWNYSIVKKHGKTDIEAYYIIKL